MSLIVNHNAGFFSCCSIKLFQIIKYINTNKKIPLSVDSSQQFAIYKNNNKDITYDFFEHYSNISNNISNNVINYHWEHQFINYSQLDYTNIIPIVKKYFEPSQRIKTVVDNFVNNYNICYENCISVYYRGTDKYCETSIDSYESFYNKLIPFVDSNIQILLQSDSAQFIDYIISKNIKNLIIIKELSTSYTCNGIHNEKSKEQNYEDITNLLSIILIISKCKYIICSSGNVSIWIMLYRQHANNVHQNLNCKWL
jgi:hypothetical protein